MLVYNRYRLNPRASVSLQHSRTSKTHQLIACIVNLFVDSKSDEPKIVLLHTHVISCSGCVHRSSVSPRATARNYHFPVADQVNLVREMGTEGFL